MDWAKYGINKYYYADESVCIVCDDNRNVLPHIPDKSIDLVLTDPPYGVELKAKRAKRRDGGVNVRLGHYSHEDTPEYVELVVVPVIKQCLQITNAVVLTPGTRNLWKYPPADDIGCFYSAAGTGVGRWGFTCMQPILYYGHDPYLSNGLGSRANSCGQTYPNDANDQNHPCAKPIRMIRWLVVRCSLEGMTILDPFMGSGTTLRASKDLGRHCIGIEIEERYAEIAAKRCMQTVMNLEIPKEKVKQLELVK